MPRSRPSSGFTLIEILAVLAILGILTVLLLTNATSARDAADVEATRQLLARIETAIDHYERERGDYPPSSFGSEQGVANDGTNTGVEALVVALWSDGWDAGGLLDDVADRLENGDDDRSPTVLSDFETRALLEIVDAWGNPIAYLHRRDYERRDRPYLTFDPSTGEELTTYPAAFQNSATGRFYRATSYQLVSAGPDGRFDTEDDVTTFRR